MLPVSAGVNRRICLKEKIAAADDERLQSLT
jgi:hypothetical protein